MPSVLEHFLRTTKLLSASFSLRFSLEYAIGVELTLPALSACNGTGCGRP
jgi:hypothetical protein